MCLSSPVNYVCQALAEFSSCKGELLSVCAESGSLLLRVCSDILTQLLGSGWVLCHCHPLMLLVCLAKHFIKQIVVACSSESGRGSSSLQLERSWYFWLKRMGPVPCPGITEEDSGKEEDLGKVIIIVLKDLCNSLLWTGPCVGRQPFRVLNVTTTCSC